MHQERRLIGYALRMVTLGLLAAYVLLVAAGCENRFKNRPPAWSETLGRGSEHLLTKTDTEDAPSTAIAPDPSEQRTDPAFYKPGTGQLVRHTREEIAEARRQQNGDIKLNFQDANLLEVIKVVLGDMLGATYTIDPGVQGAVSMQTARALEKDDLIPTLELMLRMNGAALIGREGHYRIVPQAKALAEARAPQLGDASIALPGGFDVRVVPLRFVSATEMAEILEPFASGTNQLVRVDTQRNLLILAGSSGELESTLETVRMFDIDRMAGMSIALFTPDFVDAKTLAADLEALLADPEQGLMRGLLRFIVVERLNGLMVVTPQPEYLQQVRQWVQRLDRSTGDATPRLYVYRVQNGEAVELAEILNELFSKPPDAEVSLAPGLKKKTIGKTAAPAPTAEKPQAAGSPVQKAMAVAPPSSADNGITVTRTDRIQIIADEPNNALLILARGSVYRQILAALKQLDVDPMQVLIEVTIAEVTLSDSLSFGVEWFFKNRFDNKAGVGTLDLGGSGLSALQPGFSYAVTGAGDTVRAVLNTLATETNLSVISSPSLLVLNNREAEIKVGEEVPVSVRQQQATDANSNIINSIEYRETGVLLNVKPRINASGLVIMEVEQEASQVPSINNADPLTPRIQQRKITSTVAVSSGDTIILGGLIQDNRDLSESGVPGLHKIPILGGLFGTKSDNQNRTELIVLITPKAVSNRNSALQVTEEFRRRVQKLIPATSPRKTMGPAEDDTVRAF